MGASLNTGNAGGGGRRRGRGRSRKAPMSEINVTPMVDVMLVLLIIFMVAAPLLTVGVPLDLPKLKGGDQVTPKQDPVVVSVQANGDASIAEAIVPLEQLHAKLKALTEARKGDEEPVIVKGDKGASYGQVMKVLLQIKSGGFKKATLLIEVE